MQALLILNDPPYGSEGTCNCLRLALALRKADAEAEITVFLMGDAVASAKRGQKTPDGFHSAERMLKRLASGKGQVLLCGTCMDARGITEDELFDGAARSTMEALAAATLTADKILVF